ASRLHFFLRYSAAPAFMHWAQVALGWALRYVFAYALICLSALVAFGFVFLGIVSSYTLPCIKNPVIILRSVDQRAPVAIDWFFLFFFVFLQFDRLFGERPLLRQIGMVPVELVQTERVAVIVWSVRIQRRIMRQF